MLQKWELGLDSELVDVNRHPLASGAVFEVLWGKGCPDIVRKRTLFTLLLYNRSSVTEHGVLYDTNDLIRTQLVFNF